MARRTAGMLVGLLLVAAGLAISAQLPTVAGLATDAPPPVTPGTISTVAGGSNGDRGPAPLAALGHIHAMAYAPNGDLYLLNRVNCIIRVVHEGVISTFAGTTCGFGGDGGAPLLAKLGRPEGIAVNAAGDVFVADTQNCRIRMISANVVTTVAGMGPCGYYNNGGPAVTAGLSSPKGIAFGPEGELFIADGSRIRRLLDGIITTIASGITPSSIAVAPTGDVFFVDVNSLIRRVQNGVISTVAGFGSGPDGGPALTADLTEPHTIAVGPSLEVYLSEPMADRVRVFHVHGNIQTLMGPGGYPLAGEGVPASSTIGAPSALLVGPDGSLAVVESRYCRVRQLREGLVTTIAGQAPGWLCRYGGDGGLATRATFAHSIPDFEVAPDGRLLVVDQFNGRIRQVTEGTMETLVGSWGGHNPPDGSLQTAPLGEPAAVELHAGSVYFSEGCGVRVVVGGVLQTAFGGFDSYYDCAYVEDGELASQPGIAVVDFEIDADGTFWIAGGCRVRTVSGGIVQTVAGIGVCGSSTDGPANIALIQADRLELAPDGRLYILDKSACAIRILEGAVISTLATNVCAQDIALDAAGRLFVARECRVDAYVSGAFERIAGGSCGYSGDGGDPLEASLTAYALATSSDGLLYVGGAYVLGDDAFGVARAISLISEPDTPSPTATVPQATNTLTNTATLTATPTNTPINTNTTTATPTNTSTASVTPTPTVSLTSTPAPSASATPCPDADHDGLNDCLELQLGTNPADIDSDDDGVLDGLEVLVYGTDPMVGDSDDDGLGDGAEVLLLATDPMVPDTDVDGCPDGTEVFSMAMHGGDRNPLYAWDFYDVNGTRTIDLQDTLAILQKFGKTVGAPGYDAAFDRYAPDPAKRYRTALANNGIDLNDALTNLQSFGHNCL